MTLKVCSSPIRPFRVVYPRAKNALVLLEVLRRPSFDFPQKSGATIEKVAEKCTSSIRGFTSTFVRFLRSKV